MSNSIIHGGKAMAREAQITGKDRSIPWRIVGWGTAALLLLLPLVARAPWTAADFIFAGVVIGGVGLLFELTVRMSSDLSYRAAIGAALAAAFLNVWSSAAVGMIGDGDHPLNLAFAGVIALAFIGALLVRFRAQGMARVMTLAAIAQFLAGAAGTFIDLRGGIISACFAGVWLLSAALFGKAHTGATR
jgi:hypothetical protein